MKISAVFNPAYLSCQLYGKLSIVVHGDNGITDIFGVVINYADKKTSIQRYAGISSVDVRRISLITKGRNANGVKYDYALLTPEEKDTLHLLLKDLKRAYKKYAEVSSLKQYLALTEGYTFNLVADPANLSSSVDTIPAPVPTPAPTVEATPEITPVVPETEAETEAEVVSPVADTVETDVIPAKRSTEKKAKVVKADGLNEFVSGNFYNVLDFVSRNGNDYVVLETENGIRTINAKRLKLVEVFVDSPKQ